MSIVVISPERNANHWLKEFNRLRPGLEVVEYPKVGNESRIEFALSWRHPHGIFGQYPNLRCISSMGAGVDHLLQDEQLPDHVTIVRLVDEQLAGDMYEFVLAVIMNQLRNLSQYAKQQENRLWQPHRYQRMENHCVGVMGIGTIGLRVASGLAQSGFKVIGWARTEKNASGIVVFAGDDQLPEFLSKCNYLICLLPLTDHTRGILNANVFQHLPENAYLINAGRGEHLNEVDLIAYLDSGHLSGATLDVFIEEPLPSDHPFWGHPKIKITPHIASVTNPRSCVAQVLENYDRMKHNRPLLNIVSRQKGY